MFERYVRIDDKTFSFAELAKLVGIDNDNPMISLVQEVYDGVLEASCDIDDEGPNPGIDILHGPENAEKFPSLLVRAEQEKGEPIRTFLYGQHKSYITHTEV